MLYQQVWFNDLYNISKEERADGVDGRRKVEDNERERSKGVGLLMKSKMEIMKAYYHGTMTDEDFNVYVAEYMTEEERLIGKPYFLMTQEEQDTYDIMEYNNSIGELPDYDCKKCKNRGYIRYKNDDGYIMNRECECLSIRETIQRMKKSGLGNLLELYTFDNYKTPEIWQKNTLEKAKRFITSNGIGFMFLGSSGVGKSHICTAISKELMDKGFSLKYMVWVEDANFLKSHKMDSEIYVPLMNEYKNVDVLYIDDFFKSDNNAKPTSADILLAMEIINYRYNKSRTENKRMITIISSERTLEQLIDYDEAVAGRLKEMAGEFFVEIFGKDKNYRFLNKK